jgi:hypothetical protein
LKSWIEFEGFSRLILSPDQRCVAESKAAISTDNQAVKWTIKEWNSGYLSVRPWVEADGKMQR